MYTQDTILVLKEQRPNDPETDEAFAYNRVQVKGQSPISHAHKGKWTGGDAEGVILLPISNFGGVLDEPFGKVRSLYDVESVPERIINRVAPIRIIDSSSAEAGRTPEEVFAEESPGVAPLPGQKRGRTAPLGPPGGPASADGPLASNGEEPTADEKEIARQIALDEASPL